MSFLLRWKITIIFIFNDGIEYLTRNEFVFKLFIITFKKVFSNRIDSEFESIKISKSQTHIGATKLLLNSSIYFIFIQNIKELYIKEFKTKILLFK